MPACKMHTNVNVHEIKKKLLSKKKIQKLVTRNCKTKEEKGQKMIVKTDSYHDLR